ncbi:unnamed protein product [Thlaspi arvense]|uniref:Aluminum-activated malate transporter 9 n=1 Tax=Thlaspi arvense TaxID=13288 RepID=A0AAU9RG82_THLAR|nr:unnamed protein product [Thlaspi arvense]
MEWPASLWSEAAGDGPFRPRKVIFAVKMGLALAIISLLLFWEERQFFDLTQYSIWAILTVVVMFEFSIGATLIKGFNRGLGTLFAGAIAFGFANLAMLAGRGEKIVIIISIFITGACAAYLKLYPTMTPYEYGFGYLSLLTVSSWSREYIDCLEYKRCSSKILTYQAYDDPLYTSWVSLSGNRLTADTECSIIHGGTMSSETLVEVGVSINESRSVLTPGTHRTQADIPERAAEGRLRRRQSPAEARRQSGENGETSDHRDLLKEVHKAAEQLQKKIDKKSYLLVNAASWEIGPKEPEGSEKLRNRDDKDEAGQNHPSPSEKLQGPSHLSATVLESTSFPLGPQHELAKSASERVLREREASWPFRRLPSAADCSGAERAGESATALSLATFVSLLMEFVARLQNVVDAFVELSEKAAFKEPETEFAGVGEDGA